LSEVEHKKRCAEIDTFLALTRRSDRPHVWLDKEKTAFCNVLGVGSGDQADLAGEMDVAEPRGCG
jgi:hypothetical protein